MRVGRVTRNGVDAVQDYAPRFCRHDHRPVHPAPPRTPAASIRRIQAACPGDGPAQQREAQLADLVQALVKSGRLIETGRDRYTLAEHAAARQNLIAGRLTMHRDGYGFVIPNAAQPAWVPHPFVLLRSKGGRHRLAVTFSFLPSALGSAMHGDQVLVELGRKKEDGRAEGRILRVLSRGNPSVVGTFHYGVAAQLRHPDDEKITKEDHRSARHGVAERNGTSQAETHGGPTSGRLRQAPSPPVFGDERESYPRRGPPPRRQQSAIASSAPRRAAASGMTWRALWWRSRSPNGLRRRKIPAAVWPNLRL